LYSKHQLHHSEVGTATDPDYKTGNQNFFIWWFSFLKQYVTIWQIATMAIFIQHPYAVVRSVELNCLLGNPFNFSYFPIILFWNIPASQTTSHFRNGALQIAHPKTKSFSSTTYLLFFRLSLRASSISKNALAAIV